jgi:hypothetical protein
MKTTTLLATLVMMLLALAAGAVVEDKSASPGPSNTGSQAEATGGPDDFGYVFADNAEAACAGTYAFVDITSTGTAAGLADLDDDHAGPFPFGFSFSFYGTGYTDFYVGTNGGLFFVDVYLGLGNVCPLPATQGSYGVNTFVAVYHDDLYVQSNGDIYYQSFASCPVGAGGGQCTVVQFYNVRDYGGSDANMNFEIVLFANGTVILQYDQPVNGDPTQTNGASATVGIQGTDTSPPAWALQYSCDSASLSSGLAVVFAPPGAQTGGIPNECVVPVDLMSFTAE